MPEPCPCAYVLVPNFELTQSSAASSYAYLSLVTNANYEVEKLKIAASADIPIADLVIGGNASYEQFSEKRSEYFNQNNVSMSNATAVSIVRQTVPELARQDFVKCMLGTSGLRVWFSDETNTGASVFIAFTGQPGAGPLTYKVRVLGGTPSDPTEVNHAHALPSGGTHVFLITRDQHMGEMRVSADGYGYAAEAISMVLAPPSELPPPVIDPLMRGIWSGRIDGVIGTPAATWHDDNVQLLIDVDSRGGLVVAMKARGDTTFLPNKHAQFDVSTGVLTSLQGPDCENKQEMALNKVTMTLSGVSIPPIGSYPFPPGCPKTYRSREEANYTLTDFHKIS